MLIIGADSYRRMRWKNGGGETIEIAVSPEGASLDTFGWRVSMARVEAPGPFSLFPGVDRTLAVLDGAGLELREDSERSVLLTPESAPYAFPADVPVEATLPDGAITDLNVMSRRDRISHRLRRIAIGEAAFVACEGDAVLLFLRGSDALIHCDGANASLADGSSVLGGSETGTIEIKPLSGRAVLYVVDFWGQ